MKLFQILAKCHELLKRPQENEEMLEETIKSCEEWGKQLPVLFPERTITRKGHCLSIHIPRYLRKYPKLFSKFYALEQRGESLHAKANKLLRTRFFTVKPEQKKILKTIIELERMNHLNMELFKPREYNRKK